MGVTEKRSSDATLSTSRVAGRRVAAMQDEALARMLQPTADERLSAVYRREAARSVERAKARTQASARRALQLVLVAALALVGIFIVLRRDEPLAFQVGGATGGVGQWIAADAAAVSLDFSDGSQVDVQPGGRARVTGLGPNKAEVLLEQGTLHVRVVHRQDNAWVVVSGPFAVHVVGTEFDVAWDVTTETLSIRMDAGRVRVVGPCVGESGRFVTAPESVRVRCSPTAVTAAEAPIAPSEPVVPPAASDKPAPAPLATSIASAAPPWRTKLESGELREAFNLANEIGLDAVQATATAAELNELGSAARLAGKADAAARLYAAARRRAPNTDAAANAAYHLGRMAFDGKGAWAEAEQWFSTYLAERPGGSLAPEALGRSMECASKRGDEARARQLAAAYLERYPKGAHANVAAAILLPAP